MGNSPAQVPPSPPPRRHSTLAGCVLILAFALFANAVPNGFVYDDHDQIEKNPYVRSAHFIGRIFTTNVWSFQGEQGATNYYRPLMTFGYLLCRFVFGAFPFGFHLVNIFVHLGVVYLVYLVALRLFRDESSGLVAAAVFALHPVHTESVAWIAGITDLELALFCLLAFYFFLRLEEPGARDRRRACGGMVAAFALALLSKEQAMVLPVLATLYEHAVRADRNTTVLWRKVARYAPFWFLTAIYLAFRVLFLGGVTPIRQHPDVTWPQAFLSGLALFGAYAGKLFWPWPLSVFYPFHKSVTLAEPRVAAGAAALAATLVLLAVLSRRSRPHAFAVVWMLLTLAPVLNARWMAASVFAERYLYLPSVAFSWLTAAGILALWRSHKGVILARRVSLAVACVALALLSAFATVARNRDWRDDLTLFRRVLAVHPDAERVRSDIGVLEWSRRNRAEAERLWLECLAQKPDDPIVLSNLGLARLEEKRYEEALDYLGRAIAIRPLFASPHVHRGRVYVALGRPADAERDFRRAVEISPLSPETRNALGAFLLQAGRPEAAAAQFRASVESLPTSEGYRGLAKSLSVLKDSSAAERAWRDEIGLEPFDSQAHFGLAAILADRGDLIGAQKEYEAGLETDPNNAEAQAALSRLRRQRGTSNAR